MTPTHRAPRPRRGRWSVALALVMVALATTAAWGYFTAGSTPGGGGAAAAASLGQPETPAVSASGSVATLTWNASTLATGQPVSSYRIRRYDASSGVEASVGSGCSGRVTDLTCTESGVDTGSWRYTVTPLLAAHWVGVESGRSDPVDTDTRLPGNALTLTDVSGGAALVDGTVYYRGVAGGSLHLLNSVTAPGLLGARSSRTSALAGDTAGWSHSASTVLLPVGGPYESAAFGWAAGTTSSPTEAVTGRSVAGNEASTTLSFVDDSAPPTPGTVSYPDGETTGTTLSIVLTTGTDAGSGIANRVLQRADAPRVDGTCGSFGAFATVPGGTDPVSPFSDAVTPGTCYRYRYVVTDRVGNSDVATSASVATVARGARWGFEEGNGATAADSSGNGHPLSLQSGAAWARGVVGAKALRMTGSGDSWASTPGPVVDTSQSFTVAAWVRLDNLGGFQTVASMDGSQVSPFYLQKSGNGTFTFEVYGSDTNSGSTAAVSGTSPVTGQWYHLAGVYDHQAGSVTLYVDGVSQGTAGGASTFQATGSTNVGRSKYSGSPGDYVSGNEDDVRFYDRPLSATEVAGLAAMRQTGPTGGSVDATGLGGSDGRYSTSTSLSLALTTGSDPDGVATSGNQLSVASGSLQDGVCGTYGGYALYAADPPASVAFTAASAACYRFQYRVGDAYGNTTTYTSPDVKVDTTGPTAPTLVTSGSGSTYASGSTLYYRSSAVSGAFAVTASGSTDADSGLAGYSFPDLGTGWTATASGPAGTTYSWSAPGPATPSTTSVTATNRAGLPAASTFTLTADDTGPGAGVVSYVDGDTTASSVSVAFTTGTDSGSGIGSIEVQRASAPLTGGTCGTYSDWSTVAGGTGLTSPVTDGISRGSCYVYRSVGYDNVGNVTVSTSTSVVRDLPTYAQTVAATPGLLDFYRLGDAPGSTVIADAVGTRPGTWFGGVGLGATGAFPGSSDTAAAFDGSDDYGSIERPVADDFSVEFWFRSTQGIGTGSSWWEGAGLVDAEVSGPRADFGVSLRSDGRVVGGVGSPDVSIVSSVGGLNDGAWHQVVFTRVRSTGVLTLYVDGASVGSATGSTQSLTDSPVVALGRIASGYNYLAGALDEVAFYDRALPAATVSGHYARR